MSSTARDESAYDPRWRYRSGPWGSWSGGCWGWGQHRGWNGRSDTAASSWGPPWGAGNPFWAPHLIPRPLLIVLTILGFILWWPIGLVLLAVMFWRRHAFCGYRSGGWQSPGSGSGHGAGWKMWPGGQPPSSGNHAFDEYRAETLRRLEEEQKEFAAFLERLRFAKDKAEFDQFMNERRGRSSEPPAEPQPNPAS